ncbi:hypothetical protein [Mesorhizobium carmichaelinearum]|uniref:hypothetical protein n=1 Tax=Mesorhizobium carmichaelinearum TaxID=1208188 RepID=UPI000BA4CBB8|nr:hypothetical protein [Mesorhizobium carmichaelinearum]
MTQRAFIILLILLAVAVALSATSFPGSMIGFLFAITGVFFVAVPGAAIGDALKQGGIPVTGEQLLWALAGLYALLPLGAAVQAWLRLRRGDFDRARSAALRLALLLALPLIAWLSVNSMQRAWP